MKPLKLLWISTLLLLAYAPSTSAGDCEGEDCDKKPREICLNLVCEYQADKDFGGLGPYRRCEVATVFQKLVTASGQELEDRSEYPHNPEFQVRCDDINIFNNSSHRFTDHLGTRIQAQSGPYPAILLPRGVLKDTRQYTLSVLELGNQVLRGYCYIYPGPQ